MLKEATFQSHVLHESSSITTVMFCDAINHNNNNPFHRGKQLYLYLDVSLLEMNVKLIIQSHRQTLTVMLFYS